MAMIAPVITCGISLGGWVTNLHSSVRTIENGHVTGSLNTVALRNHILEMLHNSTKPEDSFNSFPGRS
jgi:hypothetical protein